MFDNKQYAVTAYCQSIIAFALPDQP